MREDPTGVPGELDNLSDEDMARLGLYQRFQNELGGYLAIQSTRPQTLAFGLADSPAGQLALDHREVQGNGPTPASAPTTRSIATPC